MHMTVRLVYRRFFISTPYGNAVKDPAIGSKVLLKPRLFMEHVDKGFQPGVFVRSEPGFS